VRKYTFTTLEDAEGELSWYRFIFKNKTGLRWIIEDRDSGKAIGTCGFLGLRLKIPLHNGC
jgi:ribosomal-protein-alanine N-acetyltransferase